MAAAFLACSSQSLRFRPQTGGLCQSISKLTLRLGFCVAELFVFPKRFKILDGFGNERVGCFLNFTRLCFVMLPDTLRLLLHLGELLVNELLSFRDGRLRLLLHRGDG